MCFNIFKYFQLVFNVYIFGVKDRLCEILSHKKTTGRTRDLFPFSYFGKKKKEVYNFEYL
jgi:hypothetical protein